MKHVVTNIKADVIGDPRKNEDVQHILDLLLRNKDINVPIDYTILVFDLNAILESAAAGDDFYLVRMHIKLLQADREFVIITVSELKLLEQIPIPQIRMDLEARCILIEKMDF